MCETCFVGDALKGAHSRAESVEVDHEVWASHFRAAERALGRPLRTGG